MISGRITMPFTEEDFKAAHAAWGCNCGPSALAFALQMPLDPMRHAIPDFDRKRYTSPTMMQAALAFFGVAFEAFRPTGGFKLPSPRLSLMVSGHLVSLVRVQWTGPWTAPGANPRWAYGHTHWIATWKEHHVPLVFDCNGGVRTTTSWAGDIVPHLANHPRGDGGWHPTHVWCLDEPSRLAASVRHQRAAAS